MSKLLVLEIDVTHQTLVNDPANFDEDSKEYILVELDDNDRQIKVIDYGYPRRREAEYICERPVTRTEWDEKTKNA